MPRLIRRQTLVNILDKFLMGAVPALLGGAVLLCGGMTAWARMILVALTFLLVLVLLTRSCLTGEARLWKSPILPLGLLAVGVAGLQLLPLPGGLTSWISPNSSQIHSRGSLNSLIQRDDPQVQLQPAVLARHPLTIDRAATLRWISTSLVCLAVLWVIGCFADRLDRTLVVCSTLLGAFLINTLVITVQLAGNVEGLYGGLKPGSLPAEVLSERDLLDSPTDVSLRVLREANPTTTQPARWAVELPRDRGLMGSMLGGPGAYLALGSIGVPMGLGLLLHLLAIRGPRETLADRLRNSEVVSFVALLGLCLPLACCLLGWISGPIVILPLALIVAIVGYLSAWNSRPRWLGILLTSSCLMGLGGGAVVGSMVTEPSSFQLRPIGQSVQTWRNAVEIARDFPLLGTGAGTFASILPYYKSTDVAPNNASSSWLQWCAETGLIGASIVVLSLAWLVWRLPRAWKRLGELDRSLGLGLLGGLLGFLACSVIHESAQVLAVAIAASAVAGVCHRWLCGGTDLFAPRVAALYR